jgi:dTDP-4-amino-4,6-dideoxygalactose transaminase
MKVPFNRPISLDRFSDFGVEIKKLDSYGGNGPVSRLVEEELRQLLGLRTFMTSSCTQAIDLSLLALDLEKDDEIIMPSFNFTSAPAVVASYGAKPIFVDIDIKNLNINVPEIEEAISQKTKAVLVINYGGNPCDWENLAKLLNPLNIPIIEDNAHGLGGSFNGKPLGSFGTMSCHSFHYTKNIHCGEGGSLTVNDPNILERVEILREKGTDRSKYLKGLQSKYSWMDKGGSFLLSDILSQILLSQLRELANVIKSRSLIWNFYQVNLEKWADRNGFRMSPQNPNTENSAHIFYLIAPNKDKCRDFLSYLESRDIQAMPHYQALNLSQGAKRLSPSYGQSCPNAEYVADNLVRLPLWYEMQTDMYHYVVNSILSYR